MSETIPKSKSTSKSVGRGRPKAKGLDVERLARCCEQIDALANSHFRDLSEALQTSQALKLSAVRGDLPRVKATMVGIAATGRDQREALVNWSNAARRAIRRGAE